MKTQWSAGLVKSERSNFRQAKLIDSGQRRSMRDKQEPNNRQSWVSLFQSDTLASAQYFEKWSSLRYPGPEEMLMFAVLEDAITCFQRFSSAISTRGKARFREAEGWLMHEKSDRLFSFETICEVLQLNPNYIRAGLVHWRSNVITPQPKFRLFYVVRPGRRMKKALHPTPGEHLRNRRSANFGISAH